MTVCKRVTYWGRVQGVGFRYTTASVAQRYPLTGYVRNMLDGQVELVVEGASHDVDRFLAAVAGEMADFIQASTIQDEPPQGSEGFTIRS
jgi:acylphosphatase